MRNAPSAYPVLPPPTHPDSAPGLTAWLNETRIRLPLKGVECRFETEGSIATVSIDQIFHHDQKVPFDCTYVFPLPAGAAVYRCEMIINDRVVRAIVREENDARQIFEAQKQAGRRAALVEMERENLFTLSLGNVQPGDLVVIRFSFFQTIDLLGNDALLRIPLTPGVRYIPGKPLLRSPSGTGTGDDTDQVPDASRITPPRIDQLHPDAAYFHLEGSLLGDAFLPGSITSPSHAVTLTPVDGGQRLTLAHAGDTPSADLFVRWAANPQSTYSPKAYTYSFGDYTYGLLEARVRDIATPTRAQPRDWLLLLDTSGSMSGAKWDGCCKGAQTFLRNLGEQDRAMIVLFSNDVRPFNAPFTGRADLLRDPALARLTDHFDGGGTEMYPAIEYAFAQFANRPAHERNPAQLLIVTDGQVGNDDAILALAAKHADVTVDTIGIDTAVNDALLQALAQRSGGRSLFVRPDEDIEGIVARSAFSRRQLVYREFTSAAPWEATSSPKSGYAGELLRVSLRTRSVDPGIVQVNAVTHEGASEPLSAPVHTRQWEAVRLLWAKREIDAANRRGDRPAAIAISVEHGLVSPGTAFVAWDEKEQVTVATQTLVQPAMVPDFGRSGAGISPSMCEISYSSCTPSESFEERYRAMPAPAPAPKPTMKKRGESIIRRVLGGSSATSNALRSFFKASGLDDRFEAKSLERWIREMGRRFGDEMEATFARAAAGDLSRFKGVPADMLFVYLADLLRKAGLSEEDVVMEIKGLRSILLAV